jgi:hypothetical protein
MRANFTVRFETGGNGQLVPPKVCESPVLDIHTVAGMMKSPLEGGSGTIVMRSFYLVVVPEKGNFLTLWIPQEDCTVAATSHLSLDGGITTIQLGVSK